ncbi:hypothetical protein PYW07_004844 [Mythimna separata]|uniref:Major facilitator superfamily (MFS) profile domain-containing protein n=1 Tax=Mythimna separata TaxID=271217 RepID=A0AAD8DY22_MYTSE|nr:hypothetical protein PYW07_004844 [Mythimna separata]
MRNEEKLQEYEYKKVPTQPILAEKQEIPTHYGYGVRHIQLFICFLCLLVNFVSRGHMGVTVVSMTSPIKHLAVISSNLTEKYNYTNIEDEADQNVTIEKIYGNLTGNNNTVGTENFHTTLDWPKSTQEMVLGSFFLGYCIMSFPSGLAVQRWGGKIPMQIALFVNGVASILTPWLTNWGGWMGVCACRIAQGLSQASIFPCIQALLAKWVPVTERGTLTSYVYTGATAGTIIAFQLSGYLSESKWGWPSTFWAIGLMCLSVFAILTIFGAESPSAHKSISEEEKTYIMGRIDDGKAKRLKIPWKAMLTSKHVWAVLATHVGCGTSFVFFLNQVPSYIHYILGVQVRSSGFLSSLPYVVSFFTCIIFGLISDFLTNRKIIKIKTARRIFNSISQVGVAVALVYVTFTSSTVIAVLCLVFSMGCHMAMNVGWIVNHIDMAPNFGGTLMMMGNMITNFCSVLQPVLVSYVVTDVYNQTQWRILFLTVAAVTVSTNAIFVIFMSADLQPWNDGYQKDKGVENAQTKKDEKEKEANQSLRQNNL